MPNWCSNILTVRGKKEEIEDFKKRIKEKDGPTVISLNSVVPLPEELKETVSPRIKDNLALKEKYGADNWYDWQILNWGTKWDLAYTSIIEEKDKYIKYAFETAWSPPIEGFRSVSLLFPKLIFFLGYDEPGIGFRGKEKIKNGEVTTILYKTSD